MKRLGVSTAQRARADRPRQVWSWDFVEDQTENGSRFRILTILDEHTRQCVAMHVGWSIRAVDVITVLEAAIARYGAPEHLRSNSGLRSPSGLPTPRVAINTKTNHKQQPAELQI